MTLEDGAGDHVVMVMWGWVNERDEVWASNLTEDNARCWWLSPQEFSQTSQLEKIPRRPPPGDSSPLRPRLRRGHADWSRHRGCEHEVRENVNVFSYLANDHHNNVTGVRVYPGAIARWCLDTCSLVITCLTCPFHTSRVTASPWTPLSTSLQR